MARRKKKKKKGGMEPSKEPPYPSSENEVLCGIVRLLGGEYVVVKCQDGEERMARIPGRMRRRVWMREGDIVLLAVWDFNPKRGDIVYRYLRNELQKLIDKGYLKPEFLEALSELL